MNMQHVLILAKVFLVLVIKVTREMDLHVLVCIDNIDLYDLCNRQVNTSSAYHV